MEIFSLIPIKILFIFLAGYCWKKLFEVARQKNHEALAKFMLSVSLFSIILSVFSSGKIYPYGISTDLFVFAIFLGIFLGFSNPRKRNRPVLYLSLIIPTSVTFIYISHFFIVGGALNKDTIFALLQSNPSESLEYAKSFISLLVILGTLVFLAFPYVFMRNLHDKNANPSPLLKLSSVVILCIFAILVSPVERGLFTFPVHSYIEFKEDSMELKEREAEYSKIKKEEYSFFKNKSGEIYIVVIGESLNKYHMSLYGYQSDTTPKLQEMYSQGELIIARNSYSNYPLTIPALSQALTDANQRNTKNHTNSQGIIRVLNKAGFSTHWIGNQPLSTSYDMMLGLVAKEAKNITLLHDAKFGTANSNLRHFDEELLPHINKVLDEHLDGENTAIFVHLAGSHTDYCKRYPEEFEFFKAPISERIWTQIIDGGLGKSLECYNNSVRYNDTVVSTILHNLKERLGSSKAGGVIYFSDHGEDVLRGAGHSTSNYSQAMVESPAIFWLSEQYKVLYDKSFSNLLENKEELFPNDFIFDSIIGMTNISSDGTTLKKIYCNECDIFNSKYSLKEEDAWTMHKKKKYTPVNTPR